MGNAKIIITLKIEIGMEQTWGYTGPHLKFLYKYVLITLLMLLARNSWQSRDSDLHDFTVEFAGQYLVRNSRFHKPYGMAKK